MNSIQIKHVFVFFFSFFLSNFWYKKFGKISNELEKLVEITLGKKKFQNFFGWKKWQTLLKKIHLPKYITTHMLFLPSEVSCIDPSPHSSFLKKNTYLKLLSFLSPCLLSLPHFSSTYDLTNDDDHHNKSFHCCCTELVGGHGSISNPAFGMGPMH